MKHNQGERSNGKRKSNGKRGERVESIRDEAEPTIREKEQGGKKK